MRRTYFILIMGAVAIAALLSCAKNIKVGPAEARTIAKEAYIYSYPIVENYKVMYAYALYRQNPHFKAPFNNLAVLTPDTTVADSTKNSDMVRHSYALAWLDLRKEPVIITIPAMDAGREYDVRLIDLYTYRFAELSSSISGSQGGKYMITFGTAPGTTPEGITSVIPCETAMALALIYEKPPAGETAEITSEHLELFNVQTQSIFNGQRPLKADDLIFPPYSVATVRSPGFFQYVNFAFRFCPVNPGEIQERAQFAKLGIAAGKTFSVASLSKDMLDAINAGMADGRAAIDSVAARTPEEQVMYGTRADLKNDYMARAVAAKLRLYGPAPW
ncbi:MAG TPA: DUF1254 domain-containing protein [Candidatus Krumholzibacteria bacterium]|nr:DUF1254 domain-containing protein [Candidatus Krumholzibacteria bacterium]